MHFSVCLRTVFLLILKLSVIIGIIFIIILFPCIRRWIKVLLIIATPAVVMIILIILPLFETSSSSLIFLHKNKIKVKTQNYIYLICFFFTYILVIGLILLISVVLLVKSRFVSHFIWRWQLAAWPASIILIRMIWWLIRMSAIIVLILGGPGIILTCSLFIPSLSCHRLFFVWWIKCLWGLLFWIFRRLSINSILYFPWNLVLRISSIVSCLLLFFRNDSIYIQAQILVFNFTWRGFNLNVCIITHLSMMFLVCWYLMIIIYNR